MAIYAIEMLGNRFTAAVWLQGFKMQYPLYPVYTMNCTPRWYLVGSIKNLAEARRIAHVYFGGGQCYKAFFL